MLAPGAAETYGKVALPFLNVVRQQEEKQVGCLLEELLGLGKLPDILRHPAMLAGERPELRNEVRVGQEAHIEHQVCLQWHAIFVAEADEGDHQVLAVAGAAALELAQDEC